MAKKATKTPAFRGVCQSREETVAAIARIGECQRERQRLTADMNDRIADIKQHYEDQALPLGEEIATLTERVQGWCEAHRAELTSGGKVKTVALASGTIQWRTTPPSVRVTGMEAVLQALRGLGLTRFIRAKEELNKEAVLADPEAVASVKGIVITQTEMFEVVPHEAALEEVS